MFHNINGVFNPFWKIKSIFLPSGCVTAIEPAPRLPGSRDGCPGTSVHPCRCQYVHPHRDVTCRADCTRALCGGCALFTHRFFPG